MARGTRPMIAAVARAAAERRGDRADRAARRHARARGHGRVPRARLPPRRAAHRARPAARRAARARRARRRSSRGSARRSRRRSSRSSSTGEHRGAGEARGAHPAGRRRVHAAARARPEDRAADLAGARRDHARRAARGGRAAAAARRSPGSAPKTEENVLEGAWRAREAEAPAARAAARPGLPVVRGVVAALRAHPAADQVSEAGSVAAAARDVPRPRHHRDRHRRGRADRARSPGFDVGRARSPPRAATKATVDLARRPALRPARRAARVLRQPAPALHRLEGSQRRDARGGRAARALDLRVRHHEVETRRGAHVTRPRRSCTSSSATSSSRPSCARTRASSRRRGDGALPASSRRATCAATCTRTRRGRRTARTRSRRWRAAAKARGYSYLAITDHSHYLRDGRLEAQAEEIAALDERLEPVSAAARRRGEHPRRTARSTSPTRRSPPATGSSPRSTRRSRPRPDRARAGGDGEPARRLHRPPHRPQDQQARARWTSTSSACSRRRVETGTALEINSQPDRLDLARRRRPAGRRARASGSSSPATRTGSPRWRYATLGRGAGPPRVADARSRSSTRARGRRPRSEDVRTAQSRLILAKASDAFARTVIARSTGRPTTWSGSASCPCSPRCGPGRSARGCRSRRPRSRSPSRPCCAISTRSSSRASRTGSTRASSPTSRSPAPSPGSSPSSSPPR